MWNFLECCKKVGKGFDLARNEHIQQWLNFSVQKSSSEVLKRDSRTDYYADKISGLTSSKSDLRTCAAQEALECGWGPQRVRRVVSSLWVTG